MRQSPAPTVSNPPSSRQLSVVIPTFNERENIAILLPHIQRVFDANNIDGEIVVADDSSTDGTRETLLTLAATMPSLVVHLRSGPPSLARSWFEGFERASKAHIVCIDADLCHAPECFPAMLALMTKHDIVIGSRYLDGQMMKDKSRLAIYASFLGRFLTRLATGFPETDTSHSFRMFKKSVFDAIKARLNNEGNVFLVEFLIHAKRGGFSVTEIPIIYGKRIHGETKLRLFRESIRYFRFIAKVIAARLCS